MAQTPRPGPKTRKRVPSARPKAGAKKKAALTYEDLRQLALGLNRPGVTEAVSWGQPCLKAFGKLWFFWSPTENAPVFKVSRDERDMLVEADPETFFFTPHYAAHALVLARPDRIDRDWIRANFIRVWRSLATKRALKEWDAVHGEGS